MFIRGKLFKCFNRKGFSESENCIYYVENVSVFLNPNVI